MQISFTKPLDQAYRYMKQAILSPFNPSLWLTVGFTAFLSSLMNGSHGYWWHLPDDLARNNGFELTPAAPGIAWRWLQDHPYMFAIIGFLIVVALGLLVVLTWLSSRGVFMFLDNVIQKRGLVAAPWNEFRTAAHSLFAWRLIWHFTLLFIFLGLSVIAYFRFIHYWDEGALTGTWWVEALLFVFLFLVLGAASGFIHLFLIHFIAPIMYKNRITASEAWRVFYRLFRPRPLPFFLYGLFVLLLTIAAVLGIVLAGILTCCIGLILFIIPVIGTAATLPVWYTLRAYSLFFLAQFGPEFSLIQEPIPAPPAQ